VLSFLKKNKLELTEENFLAQLPEYLKRASEIFFTPLHVGVVATDWLTENGDKRVLDIGAGIGKFCISGAAHRRNSYFFGIEYRQSIAKQANDLIKKFNLNNAVVQHGDMMEIDFENFDAFYLFNPFYENLSISKRLNNEVELENSLYMYYYKNTELKLSQTKVGTRLVTYHGNNFEVPQSFKKIRQSENGALKLWIKE